MKTVKDISKITGISIRTLRYYDEIGLLKPTQLSEAGYRLYDDKALEKLQQILFFRELDIPLMVIKEMIHNPHLDTNNILLSQKSLLEMKRNRLNGIIELISDVMKGVNTMSFEAFNDDDAMKMFHHLQENLSQEDFDELVKTYGDGSIEKCRTFFTDNLKNEKTNAALIKWYGSKEKAMAYLNEPPRQNKDISQCQKENEKICKQLAQLKEKNDSVTETKLVAKLAECYKAMFQLDNARALLLDMARGYLQDEKLKEATDNAYGDGSAEYFGKAIQRYYGI